jgi:hypothetical protein
MRTWLIALALGAGFAAQAQQTDLPRPPPRMRVDERPTHYACTLERLFRGERCTYEFEPVPGAPSDSTARENSHEAGSAASSCIEAATPLNDSRPDATLRKMCEEDVARIALDECSLQGRMPIVDAEGRVAAAASGCAEQLGHALARTRTMAGLSLPCCRCLAQSRCSVSAQQCNREVVDFSPGDALRSCLAASCQDACPSARREPAEPPPAPARTRRASSDPSPKTQE